VKGRGILYFPFTLRPFTRLQFTPRLDARLGRRLHTLCQKEKTMQNRDLNQSGFVRKFWKWQNCPLEMNDKTAIFSFICCG
jgi:hypothetical protein